MVLLLLACCLLLLSLWESVIVLSFVARYFILIGKRELVVLLSLSSGCVALPRGAMGLSAVCDCAIS